MLEAPRPLRLDDDLVGFDSGNPMLDGWLKERAYHNEGLASRIYVICDDGIVVAFYALSAGSVEKGAVPGKVLRNVPEPVPVMVLGQLAVDRRWQGRGVGRGLIRDAMLRTLKAAEIAGMKAMLVRANDEGAAALYRHCGFLESSEPLVLLFPLEALE